MPIIIMNRKIYKICTTSFDVITCPQSPASSGLTAKLPKQISIDCILQVNGKADHTQCQGKMFANDYRIHFLLGFVQMSLYLARRMILPSSAQAQVKLKVRLYCFP